MMLWHSVLSVLRVGRMGNTLSPAFRPGSCGRSWWDRISSHLDTMGNLTRMDGVGIRINVRHEHGHGGGRLFHIGLRGVRKIFS